MSSANAPNQGPARASARRALRLAAAALVLLIAGALLVPPLLPEAFVGRLVAGRLAAALGREVRVEGARLSLLSGIQARSITVQERPGFGNGPFARIPELHATLGGASVLVGDGAEILLVRDRHGRLNTQDLAERPPEATRLGRLAASNVRVRYTDLGSGGAASLTLTNVAIGPLEGHKRAVRIGARVTTGGAAIVAGDIYLTPEPEAFDHARFDVAVHSLALGPLAAALMPQRPLPAALRGAALDADLDLDLRTQRLVRGTARLHLTGLPEAPPLGFVGPTRALAATLTGELSALHPHFDLTAASAPGDGVRLVASLKQMVADGSEPSFHMGNYMLDATVTAAADLARGGLPGTRLAAGRASLEATLHGNLDAATVAVRGRLDGAEARLDPDSSLPVPPISFDLDGRFSLADLSAELSRCVLSTAGLRFEARAEARPAAGQRAAIGTDGQLPVMAGGSALSGWADFAQWPEGLRVLVGLPRDRPAAGRVEAAACGVLDGAWRHDARVAMDGVPLDQDVLATSPVPVLGILYAMAGGRPEALDFVASLDAVLAAGGLAPDDLASTLTGAGEASLDRLRVVGAPLLRLLAEAKGRPDIRTLEFGRSRVPFTLAGGQVTATATFPHGGGALVIRGHSTLDGELHYSLFVRKPREVAFIPAGLADYLEAGLPIMHVGGTAEAPSARIPIESILAFRLGRRP
ncbi:MAG TPA: DUF748 domain-containing protein [Planctomycetota bacterium]|nr:DUF748 domain-containing protein [Planctomycetota bacterium]HRR79794.1 DUF748 domain-containing protein [Planctomycetota bacterium]HRT95810.1 DUF748 domain-containing protein [Planctomycetota bacterium]